MTDWAAYDLSLMKKIEIATKIGAIEAVKDADSGFNLLNQDGKFVGHVTTKGLADFIVAATTEPVSFYTLLKFMKEVREKRMNETDGLLS